MTTDPPSPFSLSPGEVRALAMVLAECDGQGFDEPDFWLTEDAYRDFLWVRTTIFDWYQVVRPDPLTTDHSPP